MLVFSLSFLEFNAGKLENTYSFIPLGVPNRSSKQEMRVIRCSSLAILLLSLSLSALPFLIS
uniref:Uncharacterized protein n=1 Tax=Utricularia reniformis TaxID=192314 RepID=A0A1Y0B4V3_9LAMI|nr:hypothetical protein AEK19_MT2288 [Utricularia reniformis]ART32433.1 hypothetical protein AEK19_MT2288 [Utricularia reniformis]